jgi:hypothetical protein
LLSHLCWNHSPAQRVFSTPVVVAATLEAIECSLSVTLHSDSFAVGVDFDGPDHAAVADGPEVATETEGIHYVDGVESAAPLESVVPRESVKGAPLEVAFCALLALINLSYHNPLLQGLVNESPTGIRTILRLVRSRVPELAKRAIFCLGNLVKECPANALALAESGGVDLLVHALTDEEDDEVSKKAFVTITELGSIALDRIVMSLYALTRALPPRPGVAATVCSRVCTLSVVVTYLSLSATRTVPLSATG